MGLMNELVEKDQIIRAQKVKLEELTARLEKVSFHQKKNSNISTFGVSSSIEAVMEIEFNELQIGDIISQGERLLTFR